MAEDNLRRAVAAAWKWVVDFTAADGPRARIEMLEKDGWQQDLLMVAVAYPVFRAQLIPKLHEFVRYMEEEDGEEYDTEDGNVLTIAWRNCQNLAEAAEACDKVMPRNH